MFNLLYKVSRTVPGGAFLLRVIYSCDIPRHAKIAKSVSFQHRHWVL
jgi:serine acetyltransferase